MEDLGHHWAPEIDKFEHFLRESRLENQFVHRIGAHALIWIENWTWNVSATPKVIRIKEKIFFNVIFWYFRSAVSSESKTRFSKISHFSSVPGGFFFSNHSTFSGCANTILPCLNDFDRLRRDLSAPEVWSPGTSAMTFRKFQISDQNAPVVSSKLDFRKFLNFQLREGADSPKYDRLNCVAGVRGWYYG